MVQKTGSAAEHGMRETGGTSSRGQCAGDTETHGPEAKRGRCPRPGTAKALATAAGQKAPDFLHALALPTSRSRRESTQGLQTTAHRATPAQRTPRRRRETSPWRAIPKCEQPRGRSRYPSGQPEQSPHPRPGARESLPDSKGREPKTSSAEPCPARPARAMPTQRGRARHPPGPARSGLPLGLVARGCDGPARCPLSGAAVPSASRARPAPQRSALYASPPCAPRTARGVGGARARTKRGLRRQSQFALRRPLSSRGAMHQDWAGSPLKQCQRDQVSSLTAMVRRKARLQ